MDIVRSVIKLFPQAIVNKDFIVRDDGEGPYLDVWALKDANGTDVPKPSDTDLQSAWDAMQPTTASLLAAAQASKKYELSAAIGAKITAGYISPVVLASTGKSYIYGTTLEDQQNMTASRVWSDNNPTATVKYRPSGGVGRIDHTRNEFVTISNTVFNRVNWYLDQVDVYTPQIYGSSATADSVNTIVINVADPS